MNKIVPVGTQSLYLDFILNCPNIYEKVAFQFKSEYFDRSLEKNAKFIADYYNKHATTPSLEIYEAETGSKVAKREPEQAEIDWFLDSFSQFSKHRSHEKAILESADLLNAGNYEQIYGVIDAARDTARPVNAWSSLADGFFAVVQGYNDTSKRLSTGYKHLDYRLFKGFGRGELNIFAGTSGVGKSLMLKNLALNWMQQGRRGLYITLELSVDVSKIRLAMMTLGWGLKDICANPVGAAERLQQITEQAGYQSPDIVYLQAQSTVGQIRAVVKEYVRQHGAVDYLCVDYLDLIMPTAVKVPVGDTFIKDKYVSEELRNVAVEFDCVLVTASQLNRGAHESIKEGALGHGDIAGGISKINTADNLFGITATPEMKDQGKFEIKLLKTRNSGGVNYHVTFNYNKDTLRITDGSDSDQEDALGEKNKKQQVTKQEPSAKKILGSGYEQELSATAQNDRLKSLLKTVKS